MRKIYASLDIGSSFIKIVVLEELDGKLNVLSSAYYPSKGVKRGLIINEEETIKSLKEAFSQVNKSLGIKIDKAIVSVPINNAKYEITTGYTTITSEDKLITSEDILNSLQASIYNKIEESMELVTVFPIKYKIDDASEVKNPKGLRANKLSVISMMVTVPKKTLYKHIAILSKVGVEVVDILFNSIGDYYCFKDKKYDDDITAVINIGSDKTELSVFSKGIITNSSLISSGGSVIEEDISYVYNISMEKANRIKEMFLLLDKEYASTNEVYETKDNSNIRIKINQYEVSDIAEKKIKELLEKAKKEINLLTKKEIRYIIITGGITNIPGFDSIAKKIFSENVCVKPLNVIGIRNNSYSAAYGMIKYFIEKLNIRGREYTMFNEDKQYKLVERKNSDTGTFSKLFGYLFDNKED